jgi:cytochrome c556
MKQILLALCISVLSCISAQAAPSYQSTVSAAKNLRKSELKLAKSIASLSPADREKLKAALATLGVDTDKDGVSDIFEKARGSNICDSDSDDDGINDKEDGYEDDNNKLSEVEVRGAITSFSDPTLVVGDKSFTITPTTTFRKGISSKGDLVAGACVKVEGFTNSSNITVALKVEKSVRCNGSDDGHNGKDD